MADIVLFLASAPFSDIGAQSDSEFADARLTQPGQRDVGRRWRDGGLRDAG